LKRKKGQKRPEISQKGASEKWHLGVFKVRGSLAPNEINTSKAKTMLNPSPIQDARLPCFGFLNAGIPGFLGPRFRDSPHRWISDHCSWNPLFYWLFCNLYPLFGPDFQSDFSIIVRAEHICEMTLIGVALGSLGPYFTHRGSNMRYIHVLDLRGEVTDCLAQRLRIAWPKGYGLPGPKVTDCLAQRLRIAMSCGGRW
jgi:hypothetical protein